MSEYPWYTAAPALGRPLGPFRPRPSGVPLLLTVLGLVVALMVACSGTALTVAKTAADRRNAPDSTVYVDLTEQNAEVAALLTRRATAVREKNKAAFLAELDTSTPGLVATQTRQFDNLVKLPFASFGYTLEARRYTLFRHADLLAKYHNRVVLPAVTVRFRVQGVDETDSAVPYVPILARVGGHWLIAGEAADADVAVRLPFGVGAQPWQGEELSVRTGPNTVLLYSPQDEAVAAHWSMLLEESIKQVRKTRPDKWAGKVYAVAVRDKKLYTAYQGDREGFAAFATTRQDRIEEWSPAAAGKAGYAGSMMVLNPDDLDESDKRLAEIFVHEITHVAMGPVGGKGTPRWLAEGFAMFVQYGAEPEVGLSGSYAKKYLAGKKFTNLPEDSSFYTDAENYNLAWIACGLIAQTYGTAKLLAFYEWFRTAPDGGPATRDKAFTEILGVSESEFTAKWRALIEAAIAKG